MRTSSWLTGKCVRRAHRQGRDQRGRYVIVGPDELAPFVPLATKSIDVEQFVDPADIDPVFFESTYYVAPGRTVAKSYVVLARALESTGKVAIVRFVMR